MLLAPLAGLRPIPARSGAVVVGPSLYSSHAAQIWDDEMHEQWHNKKKYQHMYPFESKHADLPWKNTSNAATSAARLWSDSLNI